MHIQEIIDTTASFIKKYRGRKIESLSELELINDNINRSHCYSKNQIGLCYRGQSSVSYNLNCGLARHNLSLQEFVDVEKNLIQDSLNSEIITKALGAAPDCLNIDGVEVRYESKNKWHNLFLLQHLGLTTRLMDWTQNLKIALFFAVKEEKYFEKDGTISVFFVPKNKLYNYSKFSELSSKTDPLRLENDMMIIRPIIRLTNEDNIGENRIQNQTGKFWVQPDEKSLIPLEQQADYQGMILQLIIDSNSKKSIKLELEKEGFTHDSMFYKKDENIESEIEIINSKNLSKHN